MVRSETEINEFLEEVRKTWTKHPQLRFGQLMVDCLGVDPFYIDDRDAVKKIINFRGATNVKSDK